MSQSLARTASIVPGAGVIGTSTPAKAPTFPPPGSPGAHEVVGLEPEFADGIGRAVDRQRRDDAAARALQGEHFVPGAYVGAEGLGRGEEGEGETEGVEGAIGHADRAKYSGRQCRLQAEGIARRDRDCRYPRPAAGLDELCLELGVGSDELHEEAAVALDRLGRDAAEDEALLHALPRYPPIGEGVARPAVELAVVPARSPAR